MKKINDTSFQKIFTLKKYQDIYDFSSLECRVALISSILLDIIFIICACHIGLDNTVGKCIEMLDNIGISLIGFLGFIVTGLAILTGAISSKVVKRFQDVNKMTALERILLSFYLIGLISSFVIIAAFILHFIVVIPIHSVWVIDIILLSLLSYLIIFTIFYAVKLIGNCLELFYIINSMQLTDDNPIDYKAKYNNYRITALEKVELSVTSISQVQNYKQTVKELIENDDISLEERQILLRMHKEHFRNN